MDNLILVNFLNRSFNEIEYCLYEKLISINDLQTADTVIFLGIPLLSVFECLVRSQYSDNKLILASGHKIQLDQIPNKYREIFNNLFNCLTLINRLNLTDAERLYFKKYIINNLKENIQPIDSKFTELYSLLSKTTILITQNSDFKNKFTNVLKLSQQVYQN
jgi:hypothetical protein